MPVQARVAIAPIRTASNASGPRPDLPFFISVNPRSTFGVELERPCPNPAVGPRRVLSGILGLDVTPYFALPRRVEERSRIASAADRCRGQNVRDAALAEGALIQPGNIALRADRRIAGSAMD